MRSCPRDIEKRERKTQNNIFKVFPPHQRKSFLSVGKILFFPHASFLQTNVRHKSLWHNTIFRLMLFGVFVCSIRMCLWQHTRILNKGVFVPAFLYVLHMDEAGDSRMKVKRGGWLENTSRVGCEWEKEGRKMSRPKKVKGMFMKMRRISEGRKKRKNTFRFFLCREAYTVKVYRQCCWFNLLGVEIGPEIFCSAFPLLLLFLILIFPKPIFFLHFLLLGNFLSTAFVSTISMNMWVLCLYLSSIYYFDMWSKNWLLTHFSTKLLSRERNFTKK